MCFYVNFIVTAILLLLLIVTAVNLLFNRFKDFHNKCHEKRPLTKKLFYHRNTEISCSNV